jgi:hypothetical protein
MNTNTKTETKFNFGQVVATPGALEALQRNNTDGREYLRRHTYGDWGEVCEEDSQLNEQAVQDGSRILSSYQLPDGTKFWIITDAAVDDQDNRQSTTLLLPEEY